MKIALTGDVALELIAPYFRKAGFEVYVPAGFAAWRQELIDKDSPLNKFGADLVFNVTSFDDVLSKTFEYQDRVDEAFAMYECK